MELTGLQLKQFKDRVERILHVPGNYRGGILEMTVVVDKNLDAEAVKEILTKIIRALKTHSEVFRNVRFNFACWGQDGVENKVCPMQMVFTSQFYEEYEQQKETKTLEPLLENLKKFHARSKLILLLTDGAYQVEEPETLQQKMQPFLGKKLLLIQRKEEEQISMIAGTELKE